MIKNAWAVKKYRILFLFFPGFYMSMRVYGRVY